VKLVLASIGAVLALSVDGSCSASVGLGRAPVGEVMRRLGARHRGHGFVRILMCGWRSCARVAITINEGVGAVLLPGVRRHLPVDLLPRGLQEIALALPFTYCTSDAPFLLGHGASRRLGAWSDGHLLAALALSTAVFVIVAYWGYNRLERRARRLGRLDQTTMF